MLINIKSSFIVKRIFYHCATKIKLKLVKYNKKLQNKINLDILDYKSFSGRYIKYETKIKGKEYKNKDKILIYEGEYLNGERNGQGKEYDEEYELIFEGEYIKGKRIKGKEYYDLNELSLEKLPLYKIKIFPKDLETEYFSLEDLLKNIKLEIFFNHFIKNEDEKGKKDRLKYEGEYLNGERNGKGKEYYSNGQLKFEGEYLNGKREGKGKEYYKDGTLKFEGEYHDGKNEYVKEFDLEKEIKIEKEKLSKEKNEFNYDKLILEKKIYLLEKIYSEEKDFEINILIENYKEKK